MEIIVYESAQSFLARTEEILAQNEAANGLIYGLARELIDDPHIWGEDDPFFATVNENEQPMVAALRTPPHNLVVQSESARASAALEYLATHIHKDSVNLPGVNGPVELSRTFAKRWVRLAKVPHRLKLNMRVFELRTVDWPAAMSEGRLRPVGSDELDLLSGWIYEFRREALDIDDDGAEVWARERAKRALREGGSYIWDDGGPVSLVARARGTPHGVTVNMVYTPPEYRQQGYASAAVATLSQMILDEGFDFCTLFTDLANPTSNSIYQKIGYRPVCDFAEYAFGEEKRAG